MSSNPFLSSWMALLLLLLWSTGLVHADHDFTSCPAEGCGPFGNCYTCEDDDPCFGERCKCQDGYTGSDCSLQVDFCPRPVDPAGSVSACLNGGRCVEQADGSYRCDCSTASGKAAAAYAGHQCEFPHTTSCVIHEATSDYAFCVNDGQCVKLVYPGEPHPGCHACPDFEGRHCQYARGTAPAEELQVADAEQRASSSDGMAPIVVFIVVIVAAGILGVVAFVGVVTHSGKFRDSNRVTSEAAKNVQEMTGGDETTMGGGGGSTTGSNNNGDGEEDVFAAAVEMSSSASSNSNSDKLEDHQTFGLVKETDHPDIAAV